MDGVGLSVVDLVGRHQADTGMMMVAMIPVEKMAAEYFCVFDAAEALWPWPSLPHHGRPGRVAETRELPVPRTPYILAYTVIGYRVVVTAVLHGAQEWPEGFG